MVPGRKAKIKGRWEVEQKEDAIKEAKKQKEIHSNMVSQSVGVGKI